MRQALNQPRPEHTSRGRAAQDRATLLLSGATRQYTDATVSTGAALSFITGLNVCPGGVSELCQVAALMLGFEVTPEHYKRSRLIQAKLRVVAIEWWPALAWETGVGLNRDNWRGWLHKREDRYGATQPVPAR